MLSNSLSIFEKSATVSAEPSSRQRRLITSVTLSDC